MASTSLPKAFLSRCAFQLALIPLLFVTTATGGQAEQTYYFNDGQKVVGELIQLTKNNLIVRRTGGGVAQIALKDVERVEIATKSGDVISGRLTGFDDGVFEVEGLDLSWSIRDGAIIAEQPKPPDEDPVAATADRSHVKRADGRGGPVIRIEPISIAAAPAKMREGADALRFEIRLDPAPSQMLAVIYTTMADSAIADEDYVSTQGVISVEPGTSSLSIDVPLIDDEIQESSERFTLYLAADPTAARIETSRIDGVIDDDD